MTGAPSPPHPLDRPIWHALTTRQRDMSLGGALARRLVPECGPFAATADHTPASFAALRDLMTDTDRVVLFTPDPIELPADFEVVVSKSIDQMLAPAPEGSADSPDIVRLGRADVAAMMELVDLTKPGPFGPRTYELGEFLGIRAGGRLVAMAGERLKPEGFTEVTAVCVHPEHRGQGHGQSLLRAVARIVAARGETPFLHVFSDNDPAVALYRRTGWTLRRRLAVTVLVRRASAA